MLKTKNKLEHEIVIAPDLAVFEDKRTNARSVAFPFEFPDGKHGVVILTRLSKWPWVPAENIEKIVIHFKEEV